jgi:hypothetical protein
MKFAQHGEFDLRWQGEVMVVRYSGEWNEVACANLREAARQLWANGLPSDRWGMLSDVREWTGGTPEALKLWWAFFEDCLRNGMCAVSDVMSSEVFKLVVNPMAIRAAELTQYHRSDNLSDAWQWLASQGLQI